MIRRIISSIITVIDLVGRDALFILTLATLMIPDIVTFIPTFILFKSLGMLGAYAPLILPAFLGNAFYIFMMRQFFQGLPVELVNAARVDGASEFRIFWQIMLPLLQAAESEQTKRKRVLFLVGEVNKGAKEVMPGV